MMGDDAVLGVTGVGDDAAVVGALIVGTVACPIRRPTQSATIGSGALTDLTTCVPRDGTSRLGFGVARRRAARQPASQHKAGGAGLSNPVSC